MTMPTAFAVAGLLREAATIVVKGSRSAVPHVREQAALQARIKIREAFNLLGGHL